MNEEDKESIITDLNQQIGSDINELASAYQVETELVEKRKHLQSCLNTANSEVPTKLTTAINKAEWNSKQIEDLKVRREKLRAKVDEFLRRSGPLRLELDERFSAINRLEEVLEYLKSYEKIEDLCRQMKHCNDDEQAVALYSELKGMCVQYQTGHRAIYIREYTHYWHNVLKEKLTANYEDLLKNLKWPISSGAENSPPPKEIILKFNNLTKYLFLIQEPEDLLSSTLLNDFSQGPGPCLPVRILLRPLKKRFLFHFTGSRQTARADRPEWFLTQTLTWIKDHQGFVKTYLQPVADKLQMKHVKTVDEFNAGLIALAAERLHSVLALYHSQGSKEETVDIDAAFAHAVDETLGFHKELVIITGKEEDSVLAVLTRAETFVRWLAVEKKYALTKMDETLGSGQWWAVVAGGASAAVGAALWVPRGADWFVTLLATIEQRYAALPQPGHRLQFLELQLELIEEWRVRLTQLLSAALEDAGDYSQPPRELSAVINAAHHTRSVLLQWAHSLHYLQLHFYRRQFQHFTHRQHHDDTEPIITIDIEAVPEKHSSKPEGTSDEEDVSLKEIEVRAKNLALNEVTKRSSLIADLTNELTLPTWQRATEPQQDDDAESAGVWAEAPALLAHLRDAGLKAMADGILLEFKASLRDYKKQKWHGMMIVEEMALSVSGALCGPLSGLVGRMTLAASCLAPPLAARLRTTLAASIDQHVLEEVVLENWFNTGGTMQLTHDVKRNMLPAFAPPGSVASPQHLPKLLEACKLLNLDYDDARRLRSLLAKQPAAGAESLQARGVRHVQALQALQILSQRTDLSDAASPSSVMELF